MKKSLMTLIAICIALMNANIAISSDGLIYIAEPVIEKNLETAKTTISIFKPDGTELEKILVNGVMARVSPNGKYIIYLELKEKSPWEIVLSDLEGKKIKNLEFKRPKKSIGYPTPTNLIWSPDGDKIAIVAGIQTSVSVAAYNLKNDDVKTVYTGRTSGSEDVYLYKTMWLSDSKKVLIAGSDGTRIVNSETKEEIVISKESVVAYLSSDSKKIVYVPQLNEIRLDAGHAKPPFELYQYDIEKKKSELIMSLNIPPLMAVLSHDGRYLVFQDMPIKEAAIYFVDLRKKKLSKLDSKGLFLLPKKFSPSANDLVICLGSEKSESTPQYGILNLSNGEFRVIKKSSSMGLEGEKSFAVLLMGFDWYDWR